ncbi:ABC transporter ATP-binding protein [Leisingera sp.]|uniref:ABC transporter ATP-binding protein n=1 Tax=Leisingera sp. TaxID=1879318 RepID=UPI002B272FAD|nr:ABC transporter ATP-binding protein [Leisingera sp.]
MRSDTFLQLDRVSVAGGDTTIVHDASLAVVKGEFHGLLGANGAGKTSLLRLLYFDARPSAGRIRLMGRQQDNWPRLDWAQMVGVLVQGGGLLNGLRLRDIVEIGLNSSRNGRHRIGEALEIAGLSDIANRPAEHLSGGELQRAFMAQLLARDPELYVLDEPTNHLDLHYQLILLDEVKRRGKTVLASLHDLSIAARYCDRVSVMDQGRIVAQGKTESILTPDRLAQTYRIAAHMDQGVLRVQGPLV